VNRIQTMQSLGAVGYLQKPFGPEQLRNELERVLAAGVGSPGGMGGGDDAHR
jgi:CheY-like chemotaxis protein